METIWKQFGNSHYAVSNTGLVKNINTDNILKPAVSTPGYLIVNLCLDGRRKTKVHSIHVMVAMIFLGFIPNGRKFVVHHKDSNKFNNHVDNLEIITFRENCSRERTAKSTSKYPGVCWVRKYNKWKASIDINGKRKELGYYKDEEGAHKAYLSALSQIE